MARMHTLAVAVVATTALGVGPFAADAGTAPQPASGAPTTPCTVVRPDAPADGTTAPHQDAAGDAAARSATIVELSEGLHVMTGAQGNVVAQVTPAGVVLVARGGDLHERRTELQDCLDRVTDQPVRYVIGTQRHDPAPSTWPGGARVLVHESMELEAERVPTASTRLFSDRVSVFLGPARLTAHHVGRGQTGGDVVVRFPDAGVVYAGDLLGAAPPAIDYHRGGSAAALVDALGALLRLEFETVVPGRGPAMPRREVQAFRDWLVTIRMRAWQLMQRGLTATAARDQLETADLAWPLEPGSPFLQTFADLYAELEATDEAPAPPSAPRER